MSKIMVHCYSTDETINPFVIGYMVNPSLNCNKVFKIQVEKCLSISFFDKTMATIKDFLRKKNTCVMEILMIYNNNGEIPKEVYKVLICVFILSYKIIFVLTICCVNKKP